MPDQQQLLAEIASLKQSLAAQQGEVERLKQSNAELAAAKEQLQGSEEKYKTLVETLPDAVIVADLAGHAAFVSQRFLELHRAASMEEFMGKTAWDYLVPEDHEKGNAYYQNTLKEGITRNAELSFFRLDGTRFPAEMSSSLIKDASGKPVAIINVLRDITERKLAEQALRESEERFRSYFEQGMLGMAISDKDMRWTEVNDRFCEILGYSKAEVLERRIDDFLHPDDANAFHQSYARLLSGGSDHYTVDRRYLRKDGTVVYLNIFVKVFRSADGKADHLLALFHDVTERRLAQQALVESETKYRRLVETTGTGYAILDEEGRIVDANEEFIRLTGHRRLAEIAGRSVLEWTAAHDVDRNAAELAKCLQSGGVRLLEMDYVGAGGKVIPVETNASVIETIEGKRIIALCRDITERRRADEALRQNEVRWRQAMHIGRCYAYEWEASTDRAIRTPECAEILRLTGAEAWLDSSRDFFQRIIPEDRDLLIGSARRLTPSADSYTVDYRLTRGDGSIAFLRESARGFFDADGRLVRLLGVVADVSDQKQAEMELRQSRDKLQAIYDTMGEGLAIADCATGRLLRANPAICRMLGYREEELMALSVCDIHPSESAPGVLAMLRMHGEGQKLIVENSPMLKKDGTVFYANIGNAWINFQGRPCVIGIFRDNTERKRAQEALQREHRTLKHLLQSSDHERRTIAYDIHDGLAQQLAGAIMQFDVYESLQEKRPDDAAKAYDAAKTLLKQGHGESRRLIAGIRHPVLDEAGVVEAVAHLINEQNRAKGPQIAFHSIVSFSRLVPLLENAIYRIIQEGMTNACKYSRSDRVRITLLQQKDRLRIEIRDWGIGFNPKAVKEGSYGLTGIRERTRLLGGKFRLKTSAGKGTRIVVELPLLERD